MEDLDKGVELWILLDAYPSTTVSVKEELFFFCGKGHQVTERSAKSERFVPCPTLAGEELLEGPLEGMHVPVSHYLVAVWRWFGYRPVIT